MIRSLRAIAGGWGAGLDGQKHVGRLVTTAQNA
jgi:hypothetical protein